MSKKVTSLLLVALITWVSACSVVGEKEKERADITAAIQKYLNEKSGLNLANMDWKITNLNTDRDTADVRVQFNSKQGDAQMVMEYQLKRQNGVWAVQKSGPRGAPGAPVHPGADQIPTAPSGSQPGAMPPGHPPISPAPQAPAKTPPAPKKSS